MTIEIGVGDGGVMGGLMDDLIFTSDVVCVIGCVGGLMGDGWIELSVGVGSSATGALLRMWSLALIVFTSLCICRQILWAMPK